MDRELLQKWEGFFQGNSIATPFQRPEWIVPMWEGRDESKWLIDLGCGVAPLKIIQKQGSRILRLWGADYEDLIAEPGKEEEAVVNLLIALKKRRGEWDACDFRQLAPESVLASVLFPCQGKSHSARLKEALTGLQLERLEDQTYFQVALPSTWQEYETHIGKKLAYQMRSAEGKRNREFDSSELRMATSETLDADVAALIELHAARWNAKGCEGIFVTDASQKSIKEISKSFLALGQLRLYTLWINEKPASALFTLADDRRIYFYIGGFNPEFGRYHPSKVLLAQAMKGGIDRGPCLFDFIKGSESYKLDWANTKLSTTRAIIANGTIRGRATFYVVKRYAAKKIRRLREAELAAAAEKAQTTEVPT